MPQTRRSIGRTASLLRGAACGIALALAAPGAGIGQGASEPVAAALGRQIHALKPVDLDPEVRRRTQAAVLDVLATLTYTTQAHGRDPYLKVLRDRAASEEARVPGLGFCTRSEDAAAALAYLIHGAETDDSDFRAELRASPVAMAPALAAAAATDSTGAEFLLASATAYTVLGRLAAPVGPLQSRGWMSSGVWGPPAGAAAAARLMKLDGVRTADAISVAASAGGGPFQYFYDQTEDKRLVVARAAFAGVEAAKLARAGEHGAPRIFEGAAGLYRLIAPELKLEPAAVTADLRRLEGPLHLYPKFFSASSSIIPTLEGVAALEQQGRLRREGLIGFTVRAPLETTRVIATKLAKYEPPETVIGAKMNYAFMLALYLVHGEAGPESITPAALADPRVRALAEGARFEDAPGQPPVILLRYRDGTTASVSPVTIDPKRPAPFAAEMRERKFATLTRRLTPERRARLRSLVERLPEERSMRRWLREVDQVIATAATPAARCDEPLGRLAADAPKPQIGS